MSMVLEICSVGLGNVILSFGVVQWRLMLHLILNVPCMA